MTTQAEQVQPGSRRSLYQAIGWIVTILVPVVLVLTTVRCLFILPFLQFEYRQPGFPIDRYGFTLEDRLHWAKLSMDYLVNDADIDYLGDLRFDNGDEVFNVRELGHMLDVKQVIQSAFQVLGISWLVLIGLGIWAWLGKWGREYKHALGRGGWLTIMLIGGIVVFSLLSFGVFFTTFHNVFFNPGTWTFNFSDTLIRLFPERFWRDILLIIGSTTILLALVLVFLFGRKQGKKSSGG